MSSSHVETFQNLSSKFRKLADHATDEATAAHLRSLANEYAQHAAKAMSGLACYRYRTPVLVGPWRREPERALEDAIAANQVQLDPDGEVHWTVEGEIEESPCRADAPCGGFYPPAELD